MRGRRADVHLAKIRLVGLLIVWDEFCERVQNGAFGRGEINRVQFMTQQKNYRNNNYIKEQTQMFSQTLLALLLTLSLAIYPKYPFSELNNIINPQSKWLLKQSDDQNHSRLSQTLTTSSSAPRILQGDNPFSPTGDIMTTTPGVKPTDDVLTIDIINQISQSNGSSAQPNITTNNTNPLFTIGSNISALNISIIGQSDYNYSIANSVLGNQTWNEVVVDEVAYDPAWIAANNFLIRLNISYNFPNQIVILRRQNNPLGTVFNLTYRSVRGFINAIILVNQTYNPSLIQTQILGVQTVTIDSTTLLYNVTRSLLQSLFYDFTLAPLTLQNGTQTYFQNFTLYDLRYQSRNGIYGFVVKSAQFSNGSIVATVLSCNPITISVSTQTVPVLASLNIINVDGGFKNVNQTIANFLSNTLNLTNYSISYNSVVLWSNRAGSSILYYLNFTVNQVGSSQTYLAGVSYNLTYRSQSLTYWRNIQPPILSLNPSSTDYQQVPYLQVVTNSTFTNVDLSARTNYPTVVVGPLVKVETRRSEDNKTGFRLTYYGVNGQNVEAAYNG